MSLEARFWILIDALPLAGIVAIALGVEREYVPLIELGLLTLAAAAIVNGMLQIGTGTFAVIPFAYRSPVFRQWKGWGAMLFGCASVIAGATIGAAAIAHVFGMDTDAMGRLVIARPGIALAPIGAFMLATGAGFAAGSPGGGDASSSTTWNFLMNLPARLGGVILAALGAAALAAGLYELIAPSAFDATLRSIFGANR